MNRQIADGCNALTDRARMSVDDDQSMLLRHQCLFARNPGRQDVINSEYYSDLFSQLFQGSPVKLTVGNAGAVHLTIDGQRYDDLGLPGQVIHTEVTDIGFRPHGSTEATLR